MTIKLKHNVFYSSLTRVLAPALAIAVFSVLPLVTSAHDTASENKSMPSGQMDHSNMDGMKHMDGMSMTGNSDYDFAVNMKKHHQMALEMSEAEIKNGKNPQMVKMAKSIIASQTKEIATFDKWLAANKKNMPDAMPMTK